MQIIETRVAPRSGIISHPNYYWFEVYDDASNRWWHQTLWGYGAVQLISDGSQSIYFGPSYVFPAYRGKGIQKKLIEFRLDWSRKKGYTEAITRVDNHNEYSIRNIKSCGFVEHCVDGEEIWFRRKI